MEINYYRQSNSQGLDEAWRNCQFNSETDLSGFGVKDLVTINGQPFLRQHHVTYLTGRETCRAHHFAKMLAANVLSMDTSSKSSSSSQFSRSTCKVLWIDTLHSTHACAAIFRELSSRARDKQDLHFVCLDILGGQRGNFLWLTRCFEDLVKRHRPDLVVIDDIDHFMPYCGVSTATEFCRAVRDFTNHTETAFLFIGYNHLGKRGSTTGNLGKYLFTSADDIFSLTNQRDVTAVRHACGYDLSCDPDAAEFRFTVGPDNMPREAEPVRKPKPDVIDDDILREIATDILQPGQAITPTELLHQVNARHRQLRQQERATALYDQAQRLNLLPVTSTPASDAPSPSSASSSSSDSSASSTSSQSIASSSSIASMPSCQEKKINTPLTLPPHLNG